MAIISINEVSAYYVMDLGTETQLAQVGEEVEVKFTLSNHGDETAYDTQMKMIMPEGFKTEDLYMKNLGKGEEYNGSFRVELSKDVIPGSYILPISLHFKDGSGYQLNMIYPVNLNVGRYDAPQISLELKPIELKEGEEKELQVLIRNRGEAEQTVSLKEAFPDTLLIKGLPGTVSVPGKSIKMVRPKVAMFGALPDSSYTVLVVTSYAEGGLHYDSLGWGKVNTVKANIEDSASKNPLLVIVAAVLAFLIVYAAWKHKKRKATHPLKHPTVKAKPKPKKS